MSFILNIDTAIRSASISIGKDGILLQELVNADVKDHSSFLQPAIKNIISLANITIQDIDAVAITSGPGSYTGLRVGMAAAKGICYALNKPLITINTLEALAATAVEELSPNSSTFICPMIDARRMEVFTALYNNHLSILLEPCAMVLMNDSFENYLATNKILFVGSGAEKWGKLCPNKENATFHKMEISAKILNNLSYTKYNTKDFADIAYSQPFYIKDFFTSSKI
jgi:tRNA threonylcarbamoyladenosine biosynthesis protein TsaB